MMVLSVLRKSFRDSSRVMLWMSVGLGAYILMIVSIYPALVEQSGQMDELIQSYPRELMALLGGGIDVEEFSLVDPGNFVHVYATTYVILIVGAMAIVQAFNAFTMGQASALAIISLLIAISFTSIYLYVLKRRAEAA